MLTTNSVLRHLPSNYNENCPQNYPWSESAEHLPEGTQKSSVIISPLLSHPTIREMNFKSMLNHVTETQKQDGLSSYYEWVKNWRISIQRELVPTLHKVWEMSEHDETVWNSLNKTFIHRALFSNIFRDGMMCPESQEAEKLLARKKRN